MKDIKFSPLVLFVIFLLILVIGTLLCKWLGSGNCGSMLEGMVAFNQKGSGGTYAIIPQYSNKNSIYKLHDTFYYDPKNGNVVRVNGKTYALNNNANDASGRTIIDIVVIPRSAASSNKYPTVSDAVTGAVTNTATTESEIASVSSLYTSWSFPSTISETTPLVEDSPFQLFYIPWNQSTFIHIVDVINSKNIATFMADPTGNVTKFPYSSEYTNPKSEIGFNARTTTDMAVADNDASNNLYVTDAFYDPSKNGNLYQLNHYVKFDATSGNLLVQTSQDLGKKVTVYNRSGSAIFTDIAAAGQIKNTETTVSNMQYAPWFANAYNKTMVMYVPFSQNTLVALFTQDASNNKLYKMTNVVRFNPKSPNGVEKVNPVSPTPPATTTPPATPPPSTTPTSSNPTSDYWQQYWYNKTNATSGSMSSDYLLKTQIVPPVCPTCPACPGSGCGGACTNCGGQGGSGTLGSNGSITGPQGSTSTNTSYGNSGAQNLNVNLSTNEANAKNTSGAIGSVGMSAGNAVQTVAGTAGDVANTVVGTAGNVATGAGNIVAGTIGTTSDLLKSAGSGTVGLLKDTASGATSLLRDTASGAVDIAGNVGNRLDRDRGYGQGYGGYGQGYGGYGGYGQGYPIGQGGSNGQVGGYQYPDLYSYYGALPDRKTTNYMPVTADFSSFRK
jgi:hypothetical protein